MPCLAVGNQHLRTPLAPVAEKGRRDEQNADEHRPAPRPPVASSPRPARRFPRASFVGRTKWRAIPEGCSPPDKDAAPREPGQAGEPLVPLGIVLHRTRTQRIEIRVDRHIRRRQVGVMPDDVQLTQLGQRRGRACAVRGRNQLVQRPIGHVGGGKECRRAAGPARLEEQGVGQVYTWRFQVPGDGRQSQACSRSAPGVVTAPTNRPGRSVAWTSEPADGTRPRWSAQSRQRLAEAGVNRAHRPRSRAQTGVGVGAERRFPEIIGRVGQTGNPAGPPDQGDRLVPGQPGLEGLAPGPSSPRKRERLAVPGHLSRPGQPKVEPGAGGPRSRERQLQSRQIDPESQIVEPGSNT